MWLDWAPIYISISTLCFLQSWEQKGASLWLCFYDTQPNNNTNQLFSAWGSVYPYAYWPSAAASPTIKHPHWCFQCYHGLSSPRCSSSLFAGWFLPLRLCRADKWQDPPQCSKLSAEARYFTVCDCPTAWRFILDLHPRCNPDRLKQFVMCDSACGCHLNQFVRSMESWWHSWGRSWSPDRRLRSFGSAASWKSEFSAVTWGNISTTQDMRVRYSKKRPF